MGNFCVSTSEVRKEGVDKLKEAQAEWQSSDRNLTKPMELSTGQAVTLPDEIAQFEDIVASAKLGSQTERTPSKSKSFEKTTPSEEGKVIEPECEPTNQTPKQEQEVDALYSTQIVRDTANIDEEEAKSLQHSKTFTKDVNGGDQMVDETSPSNENLQRAKTVTSLEDASSGIQITDNTDAS